MSGSTVGVICAGCSLEKVYPWHGVGSEDDAIIREMESRGWRRRSFGFNASHWFCSGQCAYDSFAAKQAEDWSANKDEMDRQREFHKYCRKTVIPAAYFIFLFILIIALSFITIESL